MNNGYTAFPGQNPSDRPTVVLCKPAARRQNVARLRLKIRMSHGELW